MIKTSIVSVVLLLTLAFIGYRVVKEPPLSSSTHRETVTPKNVDESTLFSGKSGGCSSLFVYRTNTDNTMGISVRANVGKLNLSSNEKTFPIGETDNLRVEILKGNLDHQYCDDVATLSKPQKLIGKSGKATIVITNNDTTLPVYDRNFKTTVTLDNVHFIDEDGKDSNITVDHLIFKDISVGSMPG